MKVLTLANLVLSHLRAGSVCNPVPNCSSSHWSGNLTQAQVVVAGSGTCYIGGCM